MQEVRGGSCITERIQFRGRVRVIEVHQVSLIFRTPLDDDCIVRIVDQVEAMLAGIGERRVFLTKLDELLDVAEEITVFFGFIPRHTATATWILFAFESDFVPVVDTWATRIS